MVSTVMLLHPKNQRSLVLLPIFADPWSRKMRPPNSSAWSLLTRSSGKGHDFSGNVQVSRPLLELRGRHVVVLQMKASQVALVRQLVDNVAESFTFCLFAPNRG